MNCIMLLSWPSPLILRSICQFYFTIVVLQLRVTAIDDADPGRMATADVTILVQRNAHAPKFSQDSYRVTLSEKATLGDAVIRVNATDEDKDIIKYTVIGDDAAKEFFYLNPTTGELFLKKALSLTNLPTFTVST